MSPLHRSNDANAPHDDLWRVILGSGAVHAMTLDQLDDAFQAGTVNELTPLLPPGAIAWTRIGVAAGLDTSAPLLEQTKIARVQSLPETKTLVMRLRPMPPVAPGRMSTPPAPISTTNVAVPSVAAPSVRPMSAPIAPTRSLSTRAVVAIGLASLVLSCLGVSAARMASHRTAVDNAKTASTTAASREELLALADVPSTDLAAAPTLATAGDAVEDDAAEDDAPVIRKAPKSKTGVPHGHRHPRRASRKTPFLNNGDRFDPMNGGL
jgi:hypothetical protein